MAGTIVSDVLQDGAGNSTATTNAIQGSAKAWVNFNGSTAVIRASYNVSSITRSAAGAYTINMTNALSDANYVVTGNSSTDTAGRVLVVTTYSVGSTPLAPTSSAFNICTGNISALYDSAYVTISVFR